MSLLPCRWDVVRAVLVLLKRITVELNATRSIALLHCSTAPLPAWEPLHVFHKSVAIFFVNKLNDVKSFHHYILMAADADWGRAVGYFIFLFSPLFLALVLFRKVLFCHKWMKAVIVFVLEKTEADLATARLPTWCAPDGNYLITWAGDRRPSIFSSFYPPSFLLSL